MTPTEERALGGLVGLLIGISLLFTVLSSVLPPSPGWEWASIYNLWH